jgi:hypothetical protein
MLGLDFNQTTRRLEDKKRGSSEKVVCLVVG